MVGPGFFQLVGMHLLKGRDFDWRDDEKAQQVTILSESLANLLFPDRDPIGQTIDLYPGINATPMTVVGIVNSASLWRIQNHAPSAFYRPIAQGRTTIGHTRHPRQRQRGNNRDRSQKNGGRHGPRISSLHTDDRRTREPHDRGRAHDGVARRVLRRPRTLACHHRPIWLDGVFRHAKDTRDRSQDGMPGAGTRGCHAISPTEVALLVGVGVFGRDSGGCRNVSLDCSHVVRSITHGPAHNHRGDNTVAGGRDVHAYYLTARQAAKIDPMVALRVE